MNIFHHNSIGFQPVDPLGNGLREEIMAEQQEPEAILLEEMLSEDALADYLKTIVEDIQSDPEWSHTNEEG